MTRTIPAHQITVGQTIVVGASNPAPAVVVAVRLIPPNAAAISPGKVSLLLAPNDAGVESWVPGWDVSIEVLA